MSKKTRLITLLMVLAMLASFAVGCSEKQAPADDQTAPTQAPSATEEDKDIEATDGPLVPCKETVTINVMLEDDPNLEFLEGDSREDNEITRFFEEKLNVDLVAKWKIDKTQYADQLNLAIASDELPDMFIANKEQVANLVANDQIADLTSAYADFASDSLKETIEFADKIAFDPVIFDQKLYAIPLTNDFADEITMMYIRDDWMQNLGLKAPTTMDELIEVAKAFVEQDPDGNGENDTYGIAMDMGLNYGFELIGHAYGAYRNIWIEDGNGGLAFSNIQPEFKETLKTMQDMYAMGIFDSEFAVKDIFKMVESIAQGEAGIYPGSFWAPFWMLGLNMENQPEANWKAYPIIKNKDGGYKPRALDTTHRFLVVRKDFENPEAMVKLMNLWQEIWQGEYMDWFWDLQENKYDGIDIKSYSPIFFDPPYKNLEKAYAVREAVKNQDPSTLVNPEQVLDYDLINGDDAIQKWRTELVTLKAFPLLGDECYNLNFQYNMFSGPNTPAITEKLPLVNQVTERKLAEIIMGAPIEEFETYVKEWREAGGDVLTEEINKWYKANKGQ